MSEQELTPWFPANVKPARKGVYEVRDNVFTRYRAFAYWNGERFGWRCWDGAPHDAQGAVNDAFVCSNYETCLAPRVAWRGLAKDPSQ